MVLTKEILGSEWQRLEASLDGAEVNLEETMAIASLREGEHYKFLGVSESLKREETMALKIAIYIIIIIIKSISIEYFYSAQLQ